MLKNVNGRKDRRLHGNSCVPRTTLVLPAAQGALKYLSETPERNPLCTTRDFAFIQVQLASTEGPFLWEMECLIYIIDTNYILTFT